MNGDQSVSTVAWIIGLVLAPILTAVGWVWHAASGARYSASEAHEKIARLDERERETREAVERFEASQHEGFNNVLARLDAATDSLGNRIDASHDALTRRMDEFVNGH